MRSGAAGYGVACALTLALTGCGHDDIAGLVHATMCATRLAQEARFPAKTRQATPMF